MEFGHQPGLSGEKRAREERGATLPDEDRGLAAAVAAGQAGDPDALRYFYDRYSANVYGHVLRIVRDHHEAEDIVQNVFIKLIRILPKYEPRGAPFSAWLLRVARNVALDHMRTRRMIPCDEVHELDHHGGDDYDDHVLCLRDALSRLAPEQRRVVVWRHLLGFSPGEIAAELGRTEGAVHALHHRGRRALQADLRAMGAAPSVAA
jgi:RNA polymerase sigma-70 factor (ECF subfamily)